MQDSSFVTAYVYDMNLDLAIHPKGMLLTHYEWDKTLIILSNSETEVTVIFLPSIALSPLLNIVCIL